MAYTRERDIKTLVLQEFAAGAEGLGPPISTCHHPPDDDEEEDNDDDDDDNDNDVAALSQWSHCRLGCPQTLAWVLALLHCLGRGYC